MKYLIPTLFKLLNDNKSEARQGICKLITTLHDLMDDAIYEWLIADECDIIRKIIAKQL